MNRHTRIAAVAVVMSCAALVWAPTATAGGAAMPPGATPVHNDFHYQSEDSCGVEGLTMQLDFEFDGWQLFQSRSPGGVPYLMESWVGRIRFTNVANQRYVTIRQDLYETDLEVSDNGDGTLSGLNLSVDRMVMRDAAGHLLARSETTSWARYTFDQAGTPLDRTDDEELAWDVVKETHSGVEDGCPFTVAAVTGD